MRKGEEKEGREEIGRNRKRKVRGRGKERERKSNLLILCTP